MGLRSIGEYISVVGEVLVASFIADKTCFVMGRKYEPPTNHLMPVVAG